MMLLPRRCIHSPNCQHAVSSIRHLKAQKRLPRNKCEPDAGALNSSFFKDRTEQQRNACRESLRFEDRRVCLWRFVHILVIFHLSNMGMGAQLDQFSIE